ncbi:glutaredoxin family protein [Fredinandcohnia humi]
MMYSKDNCSLCAKAKAIIEELNEEFPIELEEIDIYKDDILLEKYQIMIPVIEIDGTEVEYGIIHKETIRDFLKKM